MTSVFRESTEGGKAAQKTYVQACWNATGLVLWSTCVDQSIFSPYQQCNANVWEESDVLEAFVALVEQPTDSPQWYYEVDLTPSGALFATHIYNDKGSVDNCLVNCTQGDLPCSGLADFSPVDFHTKVWVDESTDSWGDHKVIPFSLFTTDNTSDIVDTHPFWRVNLYRYDYPSGPNSDYSNYELSAWSPTLSPSFHTPDRFGLFILSNN
jgi:hypothetical protein